MKRFKMLIALLLALTTSLLFTGCSSTSLDKDGNYWFSDPSTPFKTPFEEVCTYDVSVTKATPSYSTELNNQYGITMEITSGTYVTTFKAHEDASGKYYTYQTELQITGVYHLPEAPTPDVPFTDSYVTLTKLNADLNPITSSRQCLNNTFLVQTDEGYGVVKFRYDYNIEYTLNDAKVTLTKYSPEGEPSNTETTFEKYTKGAYVDNNTLYLIPRAFNLSGGFSRAFKTIDALGNANKNMLIECIGKDLDVKNFPNYSINGVTPEGEYVSAGRLTFSVNQNYGGADMETYYATDKATHRHRLVRAYTRLNNELGYMCYSLKSATIKE